MGTAVRDNSFYSFLLFCVVRNLVFSGALAIPVYRDPAHLCDKRKIIAIVFVVAVVFFRNGATDFMVFGVLNSHIQSIAIVLLCFLCHCY